MRGMAKEMKIDEKSMRTIIKEDPKISPQKIRNRQLLTNLQKQKKRERAQLLLNQLKGGMEVEKIIFPNEKLFTMEAKFNSQNNRVLATQFEGIPDNVRTVYWVHQSWCRLQSLKTENPP